jgi:hypothetical protein
VSVYSRPAADMQHNRQMILHNPVQGVYQEVYIAETYHFIKMKTGYVSIPNLNLETQEVLK